MLHVLFHLGEFVHIGDQDFAADFPRYRDIYYQHILLVVELRETRNSAFDHLDGTLPILKHQSHFSKQDVLSLGQHQLKLRCCSLIPIKVLIGCWKLL